MTNLIERELTLSKKYDLAACNGNCQVVQFTPDNVARVEAMIRNDSDYSDKGTESATYWLEEFAKVLTGQHSKESYERIISECVAGIDRTNSTHINADGVGREELSQRILQIDQHLLYDYLRYPQKDNYKLIEILSAKTHPIDSTKHARCNYSFATKFCHYTAFYLFQGQPEQDNFSIYDSIVARHIGDYANYYGITMPSDIDTNYASFIQLVDALIMVSGNQISRNGFDHLLWYFHKAR